MAIILKLFPRRKDLEIWKRRRGEEASRNWEKDFEEERKRANGLRKIKPEGLWKQVERERVPKEASCLKTLQPVSFSWCVFNSQIVNFTIYKSKVRIICWIGEEEKVGRESENPYRTKHVGHKKGSPS